MKPGAALGLQSTSIDQTLDRCRGDSRPDDEVKLVIEGQSVFIPIGAKHRMENPGELPMLLIEVQIGTYLGEDDIIRYEDVYARN